MNELMAKYFGVFILLEKILQGEFPRGKASSNAFKGFETWCQNAAIKLIPAEGPISIARMSISSE